MMWGWWGQSDRPTWVRYAIIAMIVLLLVGLLVGSRFGGGWWFLFLFPLFGGWSRRRDRADRRGDRRYAPRSAEDEKLKNDESYDEYEEEKSKRTEYRLGDDGELVEVEPEREEATYVERPASKRVDGIDRTQYV